MSGSKKRISAREIALRTLYRIECFGAYADIALDDILKKFNLPKVEISLATELVYGVARRTNTLDWILNQFLKKDVCELPSWIRNILRLGVYQIMFLDKIPPGVAVFESVNLAKRYGHLGTQRLVNAVLRKVSSVANQIEYPSLNIEPIQHISIKYSFPGWIVEKLIDEFGVEGAIEFCLASNVPRPLTIRVNRIKVGKKDLLPVLSDEGIVFEDARYCAEALYLKKYPSINSMDSFNKGLFSIQDESSIMVGYVLSPKKGEYVLDACSAPGTKTTHLAELMDNSGAILALDVHSNRLVKVREACERLGIDIVTTKAIDARGMADSIPMNADRVLVDAPCSGLGVLGRRPDARWRIQPHKIDELRELQGEILKSCAKMVRPGGIMVYSTCTIEPKENTGVVTDFLRLNPEFMLDDIRPYLHESLRNEVGKANGWIQLYPHIHGTDGFFICRLKRVQREV